MEFSAPVRIHGKLQAYSTIMGDFGNIGGGVIRFTSIDFLDEKVPNTQPTNTTIIETWTCSNCGSVNVQNVCSMCGAEKSKTIIPTTEPTVTPYSETLNSWEEVEEVFVHVYQNTISSDAYKPIAASSGLEAIALLSLYRPSIIITLNATLFNELVRDDTCLNSAAARAGFEKVLWEPLSNWTIKVTFVKPIERPIISDFDFND